MSSLFHPDRIARLRQKQEVAFAPVFLHRPLSILFLIFTADIKAITPNRLTTANILLRLVAAWILWPVAFGGPETTTAHLWLAVFLWHFGVVLDAADGALARYRGQGSLFGRFYDKVSDRLVTLVMMLMLSARAFAETETLNYVFMAMVYVACMSACSVAKWIELGLVAEKRGLQKSQDPGEVAAPARSFGDWIRFLLKRLPHIVIVTEMDLPVWGSIAVLTGTESWLLIYLGIYAVIYTPLAIGVRARRIWKLDAEPATP
jgi:phosphatidylglycerophosphate synthase